MHLTLKLETTKPAGGNFLQQQARFDDFIDCYNEERPHQALQMQCPAERYQPSRRTYRGLPDLDYPFHDKIVIVTTCGRICFNRQKINLSLVFAGQNVGIKQVDERIWLATLWNMISDTSMMKTVDWNHSQPFRSKSVTYVSGTNRNLCVRNGPCTGWLGRQDSNLGMAESKSAALPLGYAPMRAAHDRAPGIAAGPVTINVLRRIGSFYQRQMLWSGKCTPIRTSPHELPGSR